MLVIEVGIIAKSRCEDLIRFYALLKRLEEQAGGKRILIACSGRMSWPPRGVYFFFEDGELRSDTGSGLRVVRVGTHAITPNSKTTLWKRLRQHRGTDRSGGGNHRSSIFRLLAGTAIAHREPHLAVATWGKRASADRETRARQDALEIRVSEVMRAMPFLWVGVDDEPGPESRRGYIERNAIALLSNYGRVPRDPPLNAWLGHGCDRERIRSSGLWNWRHVDEQYDPASLHAGPANHRLLASPKPRRRR